MRYSFFIMLMIGLAVEGCTSTYTLKDFNSKKNYYDYINYCINDRSIHVLLKGDSTVYTPDGGKIEDDSLTIFNVTRRISRHLPIKEIKNIGYENPALESGPAVIELKDGSRLNAKDIKIHKDLSVQFTEIKKIDEKFPVVPDVVSISYINHWKGIPKYALGLMLQGGMVGLKAGSDAGIRERDPMLGMIAGGILFGVGGIIPGFIIGSPQIFVLDNSYFDRDKFLRKFDIIGGITSSTLTGNFSDRRRTAERATDQYAFGLYYNYDITGVLKFRPGIIYSMKGGNYDYSLPQMYEPYYSSSGSIAVYLDMIEIPLQLRINTSETSTGPLSLLFGPALNIPFKGELDEFYILPMDSPLEYAVNEVKAKPYASLMYGMHVKWDEHFSTEILYDQGLSKAGNAKTQEGTEISLWQNDFLICTVITL